MFVENSSGSILQMLGARYEISTPYLHYPLINTLFTFSDFLAFTSMTFSVRLSFTHIFSDTTLNLSSSRPPSIGFRRGTKKRLEQKEEIVSLLDITEKLTFIAT
jgi:hypothetical protein